MTSLESLYALYLQHPQVTTDSRDCPPGSIFFALKGESFDGNLFAARALVQGCSLAVVDNPDVAAGDRFVLVPDVLAALQQLAAMHRLRWGKTVLQITGTNGKTTTKELVSAVLSQTHRVLFTQGNLNNHIGVPRTLLRLTREHDIAVVETGANHPGEIRFLCSLVHADYGLITNVGRAHLLGFGSFEGVKRTKGELYDDISRRGGKIFLNALDDDLCRMARERGLEIGRQAIPYVEARVESCSPFLCIQWREDTDEPWHRVETRLMGAYNIANLRAAITVGLHFGVPPGQIDRALAGYKPANSRSEFRQTARNRLVVDAYNANPSSMEAALTAFSLVEFPRKMVILGDMRELGAESRKEHLRVLRQLAGMRLEQAWLVGGEFAGALDELRKDGAGTASAPPCQTFDNEQQVEQHLAAHPLEGYTILVKGSNSTGLFRLPALL
ncbi:MAG TPA: UDP-N-acetylmuramoyl-tripeptide--D-alanyl-D-alanine ligase [Prevotellaceae bacterium]|nr:UDP-N-acetylmuramoyl-tripeptide--D-alanyl-D-alanine ligase [Prevotellaceae bacterium]